MNVKNSWKRVVAGMLAVLVMAATVPAGTDFGGVFGGSGIGLYILAVFIIPKRS